MSADRDVMLRTLQEVLVPALRARGFTGSLPHFRRRRDGELALVSVQLSKWGGQFILELGRAPDTPYRTAHGGVLAPDTARATDLDLADRARLHAGASAARETWFDFRPAVLWRWRNAGRFARAAAAVVRRLPAADAWWSGHEAESAVRRYR